MIKLLSQHNFFTAVLAILFVFTLTAIFMISETVSTSHDIDLWGNDRNAQVCTRDAFVCPDGSAVGRTGPNCEFAACPAPVPCMAPGCEPGNKVKADIIYYNNPAFESWSSADLQNHCNEEGGTFNECGSTCPDSAEMCIAVCAARCEFGKGQPANIR